MGDRNGLFMTLKRYLGNKRNGGDWQDGVTRVQTDELTGRREGDATRAQASMPHVPA